jgi:hypothetical protein
MKLDGFTWGVIVVVAVILVAAVVTVNLTGGAGWEAQEYITADVPEAPVMNAFLALQQGDITRARTHYSQAVLDEIGGPQGYDPFANRGSSGQSSRLRVLKAEVLEDDPDRALVTVAIDTYSRSGPFGSGNTWTREATLEVVREDGAWKINAQEFFW